MCRAENGASRKPIDKGEARQYVANLLNVGIVVWSTRFFPRDLFGTQADLAGLSTGITHRQHPEWMAFATDALRTIRGVMKVALEQRAAKNPVCGRELRREFISAETVSPLRALFVYVDSVRPLQSREQAELHFLRFEGGRARWNGRP
jgi:hypothetical protein